MRVVTSSYIYGGGPINTADGLTKLIRVTQTGDDESITVTVFPTGIPKKLDIQQIPQRQYKPGDKVRDTCSGDVGTISRYRDMPGSGMYWMRPDSNTIHESPVSSAFLEPVDGVLACES